MAESPVSPEPNASQDATTEAPPALGRFRLPKVYVVPEDDAPEDAPAEAPRANARNGGNGHASATLTAPKPSAPAPAAPPAPSAQPANAQPQSPAAMLLHEMALLRDGMELMYRTMCDMSDRESSREKIFDTLYSEMREYKNDFIYEHMKPVVRPLLFLHDSLEQFDLEVQMMILPPEAERRQLSPSMVRQNTRYFIDQLVEALRICEVTQMEFEGDEFNPKLHKAVEVNEVEPERDNTIVRVVRSGWYLNGQLLRPAEVVVGKAKKTEEGKEQ